MNELLLNVNVANKPLPIGSYREYRLFIVNVNGANYAQLAEIQIFDTAGTDRMRDSGVKANQSSYYADGGTFTAYQTIDGNPNTKWTSSSSQQNNSWLSYIVPNAFKPKSFTLLNIASPANEGVRMPKTFRLEGKNDSNQWVTLLSPPEQTNWAAGEKRTFTLA